MKRIFLYAATCICLIVNYSCVGPNPVDELAPEEKDVYVTNYDHSVNFSGYRTYSIVDSVNVIYNETLAKREKGGLEASILNTIKEEMQKKGFTLVSASENPDLGIRVSEISYSYTGVGYNYNPSYGYGLGYGYGGYYDPWGYGYPGYNYYYPSYYVYQVRSGSVIVDMVDLKNVNQENKLNIIWSGQMIDGLGKLASENRIVQGIRGLFAQSPYLSKNG